MTEQNQPSASAPEAADAQDTQQQSSSPADEAKNTDSQPVDSTQVSKPKSVKEVPVPKDLPLRLEAAMMATDRAINASKLSEILGGVSAKPIREAIDELNKVYETTGRSFRIEQLAGGWQIVTLPKYAQVLANLHKTRASNKLTAAALETLAIIAYKQPVLRAEIEAVRGVSSGETVRSLMERHLVKIVGRAEELGRPMLYGTTKAFLEVFGLASLKDLPNAGELKPAKPRMLIPAKAELDNSEQEPEKTTVPQTPPNDDNQPVAQAQAPQEVEQTQQTTPPQLPEASEDQTVEQEENQQADQTPKPSPE